MKYKLVVSDVDGVWTDGSFYYTASGDAMRKFNTKDSYGISLCRLASIPVLILSTEKSEIVENRMKKLRVEHVQLGINNKLETLTNFCNSLDLELSQVAYIGDDMNDFPLIGKVGLFACPSDAFLKIKQSSDLIITTSGGKGAFREFVERLLDQEGILDEVYAQYVSSCLVK